MKLTFSQGIVSHATDNSLPSGNPNFLQIAIGNVQVDLNAPQDQPFKLAYAHRDTHYFVTISNTGLISAWGYGSAAQNNAAMNVGSGSGDNSDEFYLWIELDRITGEVEYGWTKWQPVSGNTPPQATNPASRRDDQHWYDTTTRTMRVWRATGVGPTYGQWTEVIRVFAAKYTIGSLSFTSLSENSPSFIGTQAGIGAGSIGGVFNIGSLVFDSLGNPLLRTDASNNTVFFTTEDIFITGLPSGARAKYETFLIDAIGQTPMAAYEVARFSDFNEIVPLDAADQPNSLWGIIEEAVAASGDLVQVVLSGVVRNVNWNWGQIGEQIFVDRNNPGQLISESASNFSTSILPNQLPVGVAIDTDALLLRRPELSLASSPSGGATDHGELTGLGDDDHTQYHDDARGDIRYYRKTELYTQTELDGTAGSAGAKINKIDPAVAGNLVEQDANGELLDTGIAASDVLTGLGSPLPLYPGDNISELVNDVPYLTEVALNDLTDVTTGSPIPDNYVLAYDAGTSTWGPEAPATGGGSNLVAGTNITITGSPGSINVDPAGNDTEIQFNDSGVLGASSNLTWDDTTLTVGVGGSPEQDAIVANGNVVVNSQVKGQDQSQSKPTYSFQTQDDMGMYRSDVNTLGLSVAADEAVIIRKVGGSPGPSLGSPLPYPTTSGIDFLILNDTPGDSSLRLVNDTSDSYLELESDGGAWKLTNDERNNTNDLVISTTTSGAITVDITSYETRVTSDNDLPNKKYTDDKITTELQSLGGTPADDDMLVYDSGNWVAEDTTAVVSNLGTALDVVYARLDGSSFTGQVTLAADPTTSLGAATKQYVDAIGAGLDPKESVRLATSTGLSATPTAGGGSPTGPGTTLATGGAILVLDGVAVVNGDRVLVKDGLAGSPTDNRWNGIYTVSGVGASVVLTRALDQDGDPGAEVSGGNFTFVELGSTNQGTGWVVIADGMVDVNTDDIIWSQFSGGQAVDTFRILDQDGDTIVRTETASGADNDAVEIILPSATVATFAGSGTTISSPAATNVSIDAGAGGEVLLGAADLAFPNADGSPGEFIVTDGAGNLSFAAAPSGGAMFVAGIDIAISGSPQNIDIDYPLNEGPDGTESEPVYSFASETNTGFYKPDVNTVALTIAGEDSIRIVKPGGSPGPNAGSPPLFPANVGIDMYIKNDGVGDSSLRVETDAANSDAYLQLITQSADWKITTDESGATFDLLLTSTAGGAVRLDTSGSPAITDPNHLTTKAYVDGTVAAVPLDGKADLVGSPPVVPDEQVSESSVRQYAVVTAGGYTVDLASDGSPPSREIGTGYTNSTGAPLMILVRVIGVDSPSAIEIDGTAVSSFAFGDPGSPPVGFSMEVTHSVIVPDGSTYELIGSGFVLSWFEVQ